MLLAGAVSSVNAQTVSAESPAGETPWVVEHGKAALTGKGITPAAAAILVSDAQYLMAHCP